MHGVRPRACFLALAALLTGCVSVRSIEPGERPLVTSPELRHLFDDWKRARAEQALAGFGLRLLAE
jgi:hypothetical protein